MKGSLVAALCVLGACGCGSGDQKAATPTPTATATATRNAVAAAPGPCEPAPVRTGDPPEFTDVPGVPEDTTHYAISRDGRIAAFFFVYPMHPKRPDGPNNKILWVVGDRPEAERLTVVARSRGRTVRSAADGGGAGSGQVQRGFHEFPAPGCWRLHLRSGEIRTTLDVRVEPR